MPDLIGHPYQPRTTGPPPSARRVEPEPERPRRPLYRKKRFLIPVGLLLVALGALAAMSYAVKKAEERRQIVSAERERLETYIAERDSLYIRIPLLTDRQRALLRRSVNAAHVETARRLGVEPVAARADVLGEARSAGLVRIAENDYYWVDDLTHSVPYVTPDAAAVLDTIGVRFQAKLAEYGLPPYKYHVSSVLRTAEDQASLRRVNVNAAAGVSSHEYGTTFDIQFRKYRYAGDPAAELWEPAFPFLKAEFAARLTAFYDETTERYPSRFITLLAETLIELENEGVLITIMERRQPVFHTTVARRLADASLAADG